MTYIVQRPFRDDRRDRVLQPGEVYQAPTKQRACDLERSGLIFKQIDAAPRNKDAAPQRSNKRRKARR